MMKLILFATLFVVALAEKPYLGFNLPLFSPRIVGGENANKGEFPYQVSLQWGLTSSRLQHFCGGSILNEKWILTAGHCIIAVPSFGTFVVKAGKHNIRSIENTERTSKVKRTIVHKSYPGGVAPYDIALVELQTPLSFNNNISPVNLPNSGEIPTGNVLLSGWGSISKSSIAEMPDILQKANLPLINISTCHKALNDLIGPSPLDDTNVCTGPLTGGYSACSGDSGGPLVKKSNGETKLIGIVSWGIIPCGTTGAPSVYTRVSAFKDWILENIKKPYPGFKSPSFSPRMISGADAKKGEFPYQVSLQWGLTVSRLQHFCGGAIINENWILTAGHCILSVPRYGKFFIKAGKYNIRSIENTEQSIEVEKAIIHESYIGGVAPYDIALLKLKTPLILSYTISPVNLPVNGSTPKPYLKPFFSGWGSVSSASFTEMADNLQKANPTILSFYKCDERLKNLIGSSPLHVTNICTESLNDVNPCSGDSGGPLVYKNSAKLPEIIGIVSWGIQPCGTRNAPSIYTLVSAFSEWIQTNINKN
ncbi:transmembrane protease serine 9-like [Vespa crabro]|uniref:transmembrane protease serine 9-like n=1 Tax=Vespa crabro TaxID=7445 RepID=UPI001F0131CC|nr:transmembrane protease serine 9-like [Vespa crabro]